MVWFGRGSQAIGLPKMAVQITNYQQWGGAKCVRNGLIDGGHVNLLGLIGAWHVNAEDGKRASALNGDLDAANSIRFEI